MRCKICNKNFKHLGSHLWHTHKITAKEYKQEFGLDLKFPLIDLEVKLKKQEAFNENKEKYLKNLQTKKAKAHRFKKGIINREYFSQQTMDRIKNNLNKINKNSKGRCPVCKMKCQRLTSHLYNKHGLSIANKIIFNNDQLQNNCYQKYEEKK